MGFFRDKASAARAATQESARVARFWGQIDAAEKRGDTATVNRLVEERRQAQQKLSRIQKAMKEVMQQVQ